MLISEERYRILTCFHDQRYQTLPQAIEAIKQFLIPPLDGYCQKCIKNCNTHDAKSQKERDSHIFTKLNDYFDTCDNVSPLLPNNDFIKLFEIIADSSN